MKKFLVIVLALTMVVSLVACDSSAKTLKNAKSFPALCDAITKIGEKSTAPAGYEVSGELDFSSSGVSVTIPFASSVKTKADEKVDFLLSADVMESGVSVYLSNSEVLYVGISETIEGVAQWIKLNLTELENLSDEVLGEVGAEGSEVDEESERIKKYLETKLGNDNGASFVNSLIETFENKDDYSYAVTFSQTKVKAFLKEMYQVAYPEFSQADLSEIDAIKLTDLYVEFTLNKEGRLSEIFYSVAIKVPDEADEIVWEDDVDVPTDSSTNSVVVDNGNPGDWVPEITAPEPEKEEPKATYTKILITAKLKLTEKGNDYEVAAPEGIGDAQDLEELIGDILAGFGVVDPDAEMGFEDAVLDDVVSETSSEAAE